MSKLSSEVEPKVCKCGCLIYNHVDTSIKEYTICSKCLELKQERKLNKQVLDKEGPTINIEEETV